MDYVRLAVIGCFLACTAICGGCSSFIGHSPNAEIMWTKAHGGMAISQEQIRAARLCTALCCGWINQPIQVRILNTPQLAAWSWPDGHIYLASGLVRALDDTQLSAAIAHEMGHLINSGDVQCPFALTGGEHRMGIECAADLTGAAVLAAHGINPANLVTVLTLLRTRTDSSDLSAALTHRIHRLRMEISSGRISRRLRSMSRARDTRDRTVPTGTFMTDAASS